MREQAQLAEKLGYHRYWLAEHHNMGGIGSAATSQFALLPTPNPSGNFTKITQRLRMRIDVERKSHLLKPGMMVEVSIGIDDD